MLHNTQDEFYDGEFSGSVLVVTTQSLAQAYPLENLSFDYTPVRYSPQNYDFTAESTFAEQQFLNPLTIPAQGQILLLRPWFELPAFPWLSSTTGPAFVKIHKFDNNGVDNTIPLNSTVFSVGAALTSSNLGTANAAVQFLFTGVYIVNLRAHFFDMGANMILTSNLYTSTNGTVWSFSTIIGRMRYEGVNTNQVQNSSFLVRVTSLPFYIQPRINPSANAPFPADLSAPTAFSITRVGDL